MGEGREEGMGVCRPVGEGGPRLTGSIRVRFMSASSTPGLNGRFKEAPPGGEGRLADVETDPR